ncbi:hypothetical protein [Anatilimnocola floriformis]|uniref:hypothetical protein n=1 Tax=Anatilimnocola floriformis TaxID=2948575 RepID=UPI0020C59F34|nr:hypothetical protein [Anatilimnocola floriformis]
MNRRATCLFLCLVFVWATSVALPFGHRRCVQVNYPVACQTAPAKKPALAADTSKLPADAKEAIKRYDEGLRVAASEHQAWLWYELKALQDKYALDNRIDDVVVINHYLKTIPTPETPAPVAPAPVAPAPVAPAPAVLPPAVLPPAVPAKPPMGGKDALLPHAPKVNDTDSRIAALQAALKAHLSSR